MKKDTYVQNGEEVFVKRYSDEKFMHGVITDRGDSSSANPNMYVKLDNGSIFCARKTDCFFPDKEFQKMLDDDSKSLEELLDPSRIDRKKEDFVRGKVITVPDHEQWKKDHPNPYHGHYKCSDEVRKKFNEIKEELWMFGLPVTNCSVRGNDELGLDYYHHTQDNMYYLGEIKGKTLEEVENMTVEEFRKYVTDQIREQEQIRTDGIAK